jgi:hypothetical protein
LQINGLKSLVLLIVLLKVRVHKWQLHILCPHPFIKPVYTFTGINPESYSNRGTCKYSYIIPDAMMPGIVPPEKIAVL